MKVANCGYDYRHDKDYTAKRPTGSRGHILMIIRSPARILLNNQMHRTKGNCVVLYHKDTPQFFCADNTEFINDWVRFQLDDEDYDFFKKIGIEFDVMMEYADVYPLSRFVKIMAMEKWSSNKNSVESTNLLLRLLLLKLSDYIVKKPEIYSQFTDKLTILRNNIYTNPENNWSIDNICKSISISPSYLQHKYKQLFGNSVKDDILESKIQYSKSLLINTSYTIAAISHMVGYTNEFSFLSIFKKKTGFTPSQYRNSTLSVRK